MSYGVKSELKVVEQHFNERYGIAGYDDVQYARKVMGLYSNDEQRDSGIVELRSDVGAEITLGATQPSLQGTILDEAKALVYGDREAAYSHPYDDFKRIGDVWSGYLGVAITPQDVAQMMILLKVCRVRVDVLHDRRPKHDTIVDEAGYAECAARVAERTDANKAA